MAKVRTTEIGKVYYTIEYDVPNDIAKEIEELEELGKTEEIKSLLEEHGYVKYSEQENNGEAFEFELESVDEIDGE